MATLSALRPLVIVIVTLTCLRFLPDLTATFARTRQRSAIFPTCSAGQQRFGTAFLPRLFRDFFRRTAEVCQLLCKLPKVCPDCVWIVPTSASLLPEFYCAHKKFPFKKQSGIEESCYSMYVRFPAKEHLAHDELHCQDTRSTGLHPLR